MMKYKLREKNEVYRPRATVLKAKHGVPTKLRVSGLEYALVHSNYINGNKNKVKP